MSVGNVARIVAVLVAGVAAAGSATSSSGSGSNQNQSFAGQPGQNSPPAPQQMEPNLALGLWSSTFGAVKIEADNSQGGLGAGNLQGIWMYQRQGQEIVGYFAGNLRGNVLQFHWQEPNNPPLTGEGYLVFDLQGRQYSGRWWSDKRDRVGDWNGWRQSAQAAQYGGDDGTDGGQSYGSTQPQPPPYRRSQPYRPYPPQPYQPQPGQSQPYPPQPGQPQPYPPQPYQQPYPPQSYPQRQPSQQPPQQVPAQQPTYYN